MKAGSPEELFSDAMMGMFAIMRGRIGTAQIIRHQIEVESGDRTSLLVDFLSEVLTRSHLNREVFDQVDFASLTENSCRGTIRGYSPVQFEQDVKAVTYHEADVRYENGMWSTTLVFDI